MTAPTTPFPEDQDTKQGFVLAITVYLFWGFFPLYLKLLDHIPPVEVVAHRILWSIPIAGALLIVTGRTQDLKQALKSPSVLAMAALTATLVSINWGIYVWAIASGNAVEAALGYYINPLFSVFLGAVLLRERLTRAQIIAIALAACAVLLITIDAGTLPWAALGLTFSWGFYAFFKRRLPIGPNQGFMLEVLILSPIALGFILWLAQQGTGHFLASATDMGLLLGSGAATAIPLLIYANAAKGLRLSTIGILQYITPTMIFLIAIFLFGEDFSGARLIAFPMIWVALIIYTTSMLRRMRGRA
ncbi:EamA family transporter RarD [Aestuariivita boseongensis]|uniref:EamA family transporter RarD n=1 Tax=Aestuariivita boseongensis TaxID=1470562 RepID=UPI000680A8A7|nr:EamA family transporter RarD [Aestuariivita boseongensis]